MPFCNGGACSTSRSVRSRSSSVWCAGRPGSGAAAPRPARSSRPGPSTQATEKFGSRPAGRRASASTARRRPEMPGLARGRAAAPPAPSRPRSGTSRATWLEMPANRAFRMQQHHLALKRPSNRVLPGGFGCCRGLRLTRLVRQPEFRASLPSPPTTLFVASQERGLRGKTRAEISLSSIQLGEDLGWLGDEGRPAPRRTTASRPGSLTGKNRSSDCRVTPRRPKQPFEARSDRLTGAIRSGLAEFYSAVAERTRVEPALAVPRW